MAQSSSHSISKQGTAALPGLKQFRHEGCLSYFVFDRGSRVAAVIDPRADQMESYREFIAENGLTVAFALDTHIHADHFSGTHLFLAEYRSEIGMSHRTESARPGRKLTHGDRLEIGSLKLSVLETPGHTPDSLCFYGEGMVFTGDTLLIGAAGRTDFPGADPAAQWNSLHRVLAELPPATVVLPGHDYNDLLFSIIEVESRTNPQWLIEDQASFVAFKQAESIPHLSDEVRKRVVFNQAATPDSMLGTGAGAATACGVATPGSFRPTSISVEKYSHKLREAGTGHLFIDVRELDEFREGHMPGVRNLPLSELALYLTELRAANRLYLSCLSGRRSSMAAKTLSRLGLPDVVNVSGGFQAWQNAGFPIEK